MLVITAATLARKLEADAEGNLKFKPVKKKKSKPAKQTAAEDQREAAKRLEAEELTPHDVWNLADKVCSA